MADPAGLILVAKWPGEGGAKSRLAAGFARAAITATDVGQHAADEAAAAGRRAASSFALASVSDLLVRFGDAACQRVLLYAPATTAAAEGFAALLRRLGLSAAWALLPVRTADSHVHSSDLGSILIDAAVRVRRAFGCGRVCYIGMDAPELPHAAFNAALDACAAPGMAYVNPADDGGFTLLALSADAPAEAAFADVRWSSADTCASQLAALSRAGIQCSVGPTFADVDEIDDLRALDRRLRGRRAEAVAEAAVASDVVMGAASNCAHTVAFLARLDQGFFSPASLHPL